MVEGMLRKPLTRVVIAAVAVAAAFAVSWFAPWKLFTDRTVHEALSSPAPVTSAPAGRSAPTGPVLLRQGAFVAHEHATAGTARLVRQPDGSRTLEIAGLSTSDGPDLRVWLTDQPVRAGTAGWRVFDDGKYLELGKLKGNHGDQVYPVPAAADLDAYRSVSIWCVRFSVSFGAAELA